MGDLTTAALVKSRAGVTTSDYDTLIGQIVSHISEDMEARMNRIVAEDTYTEYYDGTGTNHLILRQGPLVSVTSVHSVAYDDAGDGSRQETLTELVESARLENGLRSHNHRGAGDIVYPGGTFTKGDRNWKVVYVAGWTTTPDSLERWATWLSVAEWRTREAAGLTTNVTGDSSFSLLSPKQMSDQFNRAIAPYRLPGVG
jgi:hypothetical protein